MTLSELKTGKEGIITKVGGEGALRLRLLDMGIIPRTKVKVEKTAPLGDPIQIFIRGYNLTIRKDDASVIEVTQEV
jgi:ferrous iron transport protein A